MYKALIHNVETKEYELYLEEAFEFSKYLWSEGNFSCDCNRHNLFRQAQGLCYEKIPCGEGKYLVKIVDKSGNVLYSEF